MPDPYRATAPRSWGKPLLLPILALMVPLTGCRLGRSTGAPVAFSATTEVIVPAATSEIKDFNECLALAMATHPRLIATRASLAASEDGKRALDRMHLPATLDPQIPVRRQQAAVGLNAPVAGLAQAELEAAYAVTRTYVTVLYAREQERLAQGVVERLKAVNQAASEALEAGARDASAADVKRTLVYARLAETKRIQATQGVKRALVALREASGLGAETILDVKGDRLSIPDTRPNRDEVLAGALAKRGEIIQTKVFAQVACLEVEAQGTSRSQRMPTFASGTDIHAQQVPQGANGTDYRPAGINPEMPTMLVGSRAERVKHAGTLTRSSPGCGRIDAEAHYARMRGCLFALGRSIRANDLGP